MITNSIIASGDQLGAQMVTLANLYYLAKENDQELVFCEELKDYRRGLQFYNVFDMDQIRLIRKSSLLEMSICCKYCAQFKQNKNWKAKNKRIYGSKIMGRIDRYFLRFVKMIYRDFELMRGLKSGVRCDPALLKLDKSKNYDIRDGFGTFRDWGKYANEIRELYRFKDDVKRQGDAVWDALKISKPTVSIHFRRTDYLVLSSLNLTLDYYEEAMSHFDKYEVSFVVLSDDIEGVKEMNFFDGCDAVYMPGNPAAVDMYLMSKSDHNIIANSTFSFWGAFLNENPNKKVVCPYNFIGGSDPGTQYINGNYYPSDWIALN